MGKKSKKEEIHVCIWLPQWLRGKELGMAGDTTEDLCSIPGSWRSPGEENGNPLQYSCLENPMAEEPRAIVHGVAKKSDVT